MDDIAQYNIERWAELARARAVFTRPLHDLTPETARDFLDPERRLGDLAGRRVLCLAGGGGQQSIACALLGAHVVVVDLSAEQLQRDVETAASYGLALDDVLLGDMRDLSRLEPASFDLVYHPYSLNFVPDVRVVFREVARVLRAGGLYHFNCANPFTLGIQARHWNGEGYELKLPYVDGAEVISEDEPWVFRDASPPAHIKRLREYRHTLGSLVNGLVENAFVIVHVMEEHFGVPDANASPGTPEHLSGIAPLWLRFWATYRPDVLRHETGAVAAH